MSTPLEAPFKKRERPLTMPTVDEFDAAREAMAEAVERIMRLRWTLTHLADWNEERGGQHEDDEVLKLEHVGLAFSFGTVFESYLKELSDDVEGVVASVEDLDITRERRELDAEKVEDESA